MQNARQLSPQPGPSWALLPAPISTAPNGQSKGEPSQVLPLVGTAPPPTSDQEEEPLSAEAWAATLDLVRQSAARIRQAEESAKQIADRAREYMALANQKAHTAEQRAELAEARAAKAEAEAKITAERLRAAEARAEAAEAQAKWGKRLQSEIKRTFQVYGDDHSG